MLAHMSGPSVIHSIQGITVNDLGLRDQTHTRILTVDDVFLFLMLYKETLSLGKVAQSFINISQSAYHILQL